MNSSEEKNRKVSPSYIEVIVLSALTAVGCLYVYDTYFAQKIAVFDQKQYKEQQSKLYLEGRFNEERHKHNLARMKEFIKDHPNMVFLEQDTVAANGKVIKISDQSNEYEQTGKNESDN